MLWNSWQFSFKLTVFHQILAKQCPSFIHHYPCLVGLVQTVDSQLPGTLLCQNMQNGISPHGCYQLRRPGPLSGEWLTCCRLLEVFTCSSTMFPAIGCPQTWSQTSRTWFFFTEKFCSECYNNLVLSLVQTVVSCFRHLIQVSTAANLFCSRVAAWKPYIALSDIVFITFLYFGILWEITMNLGTSIRHSVLNELENYFAMYLSKGWPSGCPVKLHV